MGDILIAVGICLLTAAMAYMGVHVTLHPPDSDNLKRAWKVGFCFVAVLACVLIAWQTKRGASTQSDLQVQLKDIRKNITKPPSAQENAEALYVLENKKKPVNPSKVQRPSNDPKIPKKPSEQPTTPIALPPTAEPAPMVAHFSVTQNQEVSSRADAPYKIRVVVQTNMDLSALRLAVQCDSPIVVAQAGNTGMFIGGHGIVNGHPNVYVINYRSITPPFGPANPIILYMWSANPIRCNEISTF
ncbi:MAG: hypothetical protein WBM14_15925 [Terracidiphilus sp.]|jgi:hypothetical protein